MIIDPPSPFAPLADWKKFLADMERLPPTAETAEYIETAKTEIAGRT